MDAPERERCMKKSKIAAFAVMGAIVLLAACGIRSDQSVTSGEMVVPEVSSEDLLISSLEYLLLDETEEPADTDGQETQGQNEGEPDAQNVQDVRDEAEAPEDIPDVQPGQTEDDTQGVAAVIYYGNGGSVALKQEKVAIEAVTPDELVSALARHNIVSLDTKVLSFEQEEQDGASVLYLDLSKAAGEYLRTMSKEAECIIVSAVANTFLDNYGSDRIYITVEGEALTTSNADYTNPLERCTPEELLQMLQTADVDNT